MALTYCEWCEQIEGETKELDGEQVCAECDEPVRGLPEHDDLDLER